MIKKLNLGCGETKKEGYINIDNRPECEPDILRDITRGLPFDDESIDEIFSSHFMEHLGGEDVFFVINECWRVLKPNGILIIIVPYIGVQEAFCDPMHKSYWSKRSAMYITTLFRKRYGVKPFKVIENKIVKDFHLYIKLQKVEEKKK